MYLALAPATKRSRGLSEAEVDAMDISTVAALLGVGSTGMGGFEDAAAELNRRRVEAAKRGETVTWD